MSRRCVSALTFTWMLGILAISVILTQNGMAIDLGGETIYWPGHNTSGVEYYENGTIICTGDLMITGSLTLENITLKMNCSYDGEYGIQVSSNTGSFNVINSTITSQTPYAYDFFITGTHGGCCFFNSTIENVGHGNGSSGGISIQYSDNIIISNCTIRGCFFHGIGIIGSDVEIYNNTIVDNIGMALGNQYGNGIEILEDSNVRIENNTIANNGYMGISFQTYDGSSIVILNNNITNNSRRGISFHYCNATIVNNTITHNKEGGIYFNEAFPVICENNITDNNGEGIFISRTSATIERNIVLFNSDGIYCYDSTPKIVNCIIAQNENNDFYIRQSSHLISLNTTFNKDKVWIEDDSIFESKWFMHVRTIDEIGQPVPNANVSVEDVFDSNIYFGSTDATGYCRWIVCIQYVQNKASEIYYTPHNVTVANETKMGYADPEPIMEKSKTVVVALTRTVTDTTPPIADAGIDQVVSEDTLVTFDGSGSSDNVGIDNYTWTFLEEDILVVLYDVKPTYVFNTRGYYLVTLNVTDLAGYWDTDTVWINVTDTTPPTVLSTIPTIGETDAPIDTDIVITFSEKMNKTTVQGNITLSPSIVIQSHEWSDGNKTVTLILPSLSSGITYIVSVNTNVEDLAGNNMESEYLFSFTTEDVTSPAVSSTLPRNGQIDVPINTTITIVFSEAMNKTTVQNAITISDDLSPTSFSWSNENTMVTFAISDNLNYDTQYTITIDAKIAKDIAGNKLDGDNDGVGGDDYSWSFTTELGTGTISGTIKDKRGNPIGNATVTVYYANGTIAGTTKTYENGNYAIDVPPGTYDVKIEKSGYKTQWKKDVVVTADQTTTTNLTLSLTVDILRDYWWLILLLIIVIVMILITMTLIAKKKKPVEAKEVEEETEEPEIIEEDEAEEEEPS